MSFRPLPFDRRRVLPCGLPYVRVEQQLVLLGQRSCDFVPLVDLQPHEQRLVQLPPDPYAGLSVDRLAVLQPQRGSVDDGLDGLVLDRYRCEQSFARFQLRGDPILLGFMSSIGMAALRGADSVSVK